MDFGDAFINLGRGSFDARNRDIDIRTRSERIGAALRSLSRFNNIGVLYFPPGVYELQRGFDVPEGVSVILAPGARLVPSDVTNAPELARAERDIIIRGCIEASDVQFIEPPYNADGSPNLSRGRLILLTNRVAEVYPEWFGASNVSSQDSYSAIQAALDAAYNDRRDAPDFDPAPIPVCFHGSYHIGRPLRIGLDPRFGRSLGRSHPFVLRGHQGGYPGPPDARSLDCVQGRE
ncbi:MAG: hypothetical protein R3A52_23960 [Polyangiales bacterium]